MRTPRPPKGSAPPARPDAAARAAAAAALAVLEKRASAKVKAGMARYGIPSHDALGVPVGRIRDLGKRLGRDAALAEALWRTGVYEARLLACFVGEPDRLDAAAMDRWCGDFDSWAVCDTACFHLFDRSPLAPGRVDAWAAREPEFERRAAFALLASLALHDRALPDAAFLERLPLVRAAARDPRPLVRKGVSWALRSVGARSPALLDAATALARELAVEDDAGARWVGKDALRDLGRPLVRRRAERRAAKAGAAAARGQRRDTASLPASRKRSLRRAQAPA